ncbi:FAD-binding domain-containing protein [Pelagibius sp.]|uniref:FAD-binding domain-containing protein n=1 Tax=Pelagibius sp. TaxID=1931238 RepID=UPI003B514AEC
MTDPVHVVWFKRDLRIADHRALTKAAAQGAVLPLFVAEPALWRQPDMAGRHWAFVADCLVELRHDLEALGQPLVVRVGSVTEVLETIDAARGIAALWSHEETGNAWTYARDLEVAAWCRARGVTWHQERQNGVMRRLGSRDGWARRWDRFMAEPATAPPPALPSLAGLDPGGIPAAADLGLGHDPCPQRQRGGRDAALERLQTFLSERGRDYRRAMSNPAEGAAACSRLSPHLAWGSLSAREVTQATWARQKALKAAAKEAAARETIAGWRGSMTSFAGRLHWRCHFAQKLEDEPRLEFACLHSAYEGLRPAEPDRARLMAWCNGETGLPFVDACMRALTATGWMNFRMRAMLTAVASYHLWLDWRRPGEHLARLFTDYDPGIHWPQVQMQSGTTGINTVRIYNPVKQGHDQDPQGAFVRRWLPELAAVPDQFIHEPWRWEAAGRVLDRDYPFPIVDHLAAAKEARQKVWAVRRGAAYRATADAIQDKHGSRKSGVRPVVRPKRRSPPGDQLSLSLGREEQS